MPSTPQDTAAALHRVAEESGFSGVFSVETDGEPVGIEAHGFSDRGHGILNSPDTRFALASSSKGFTALATMALIEDGVLALDTPVRGILGDDLPLVDDAVTVEHLLSHTSGIGDYLDEEADWEVDDYVLTRPVHELDGIEAFLVELDGHPQKSEPGTAFSYNNGGYMVLALVAERASGVPFPDLVERRVFGPAGLHRTGYLRSDELPGDAAIGYLYEDPSSLRTNVLHLPVRGSGDGGAYSTAADLSRFWRAFMDGRIVDPATRDEMIRPRNLDEAEGLRYGLGFYLDLEGPGIMLMGYDAGVSAWTRFDPSEGTVTTILSNSSEGAWDLVRAVRAPAED